MHFKKYGGPLPVLCGTPYWAIPEKNPISGIKGHETSMGIEETCGISGDIKKRPFGNSSGQRKKKWNSKINHVEFPWVVFFDLGISKGFHKIFQNFQR